MTATNAERIAVLNDRFRARIGAPQCGSPAVPGTLVMTAGIAALAPELQIEIWARVRAFADFSEDNDPYGERDFGAFDLGGVGKIFWKIDYYADAEMRWGSEDPADPAQCYRALTVMLAEEY
jgi:hypothetical protein